MRPHSWWVDRKKDLFLQPTGNTPTNAAWDTIDLFLLHRCIAGVLVQLALMLSLPFIRTLRFSSAKLLSSQLNPSICWCLGLLWMHNFVLPFVELREMPVCPFFTPVEFFLSYSSKCSSKSCNICKLAEGACYSIVRVNNQDVEQ